MMKGTDELVNLVAVLFSELGKLGFDLDGGAIVLNIFDHQTDDITQWIIDANHQFPYSFKHPQFDNPILNDIRNAKKNGVRYFSNTYSKSVKNAFWNFYFSNTDFQRFPKKLQKEILNKPSYAQSMALGKNTAILHPNINGSVLDKDQQYILQRFANVFEQSYSRFLDLQKAEAQAREAQIEGALEKVRSRSLAMHKSDELKELVAIVFEKMNEFLFLTDSGVSLVTDFKAYEYADHWVAADKVGEPLLVRFPYTENSIPKEFTLAKINGTSFYSKRYPKEVVQENWRLNFEYGLYKDYPDEFKNWFLTRDVAHFTVAFEKNSAITVTTNIDQPPTEEQKVILQRFAKVFEQSYTRFLDLQKAEAQAREAQLEAALERVRSKTIGMHSSQDVGQAVLTMFNELSGIGNKSLRSGILIINENITMDVWTAHQDGSIVIGNVDMQIHKLLKEVFDSWKRGEQYFVYKIGGKEQSAYFKAINDSSDYPIKYDIKSLPKSQFCHCFFFSEGAIFAWGESEISGNLKIVFQRFADVFRQTYKRYIDLQKAEAQAREALIELALERVRAKTMAMHNSEDVGSAIATLFTELGSQGIENFRCGIAIINIEKTMEVWSVTNVEEGKLVKAAGNLNMNDHELWQLIFDNWENKQDFLYYHLSGNEKQAYIEILNSAPDYLSQPILEMPDLHCQSYFFSEGGIWAYSLQPHNAQEQLVMKRFTSVFSQTYLRYRDLKKAEASAILSKKQAAIDRIRAEVAAMRTKQDLDYIIPIIWRELSLLSIPFIRCGIFIMDDDKRQISVFLSTPEGQSLAAFELDYHTELFSNILQSWQKKEIFITEWGGDEFSSLAKMIWTDDQTQHKHYISSIPTDQLYLHFVPFLQGILYVGNTSRLGESQLQQVLSIADALSAAYARYEDFRKLEAAKQQIEKTLVDLQATQKQLVQAEKMASLGELTAGIAHEIQNPLNFVNNFSEVSTELVKEMVQEVDKGNTDEVKAIANDVVQNLEKINHHGQRAAEIVKGMLQHSRSSSGVKEPTDINALADEYFRLAYHGLRAKDKTFNATMKTDFDESIGKINIIPKDIGRVVLNLITNAFYAVNEKSKQGITNYEPTVSVVTKKVNHQVEISVTDNGNGIPANIVDKIFQPFFTTKPTGQGTGLGLSLSYDIVKGHGGEIMVESKEGVGSDFIIQLPIV
jgi:signal transduction histidine kinase